MGQVEKNIVDWKNKYTATAALGHRPSINAGSCRLRNEKESLATTGQALGDVFVIHIAERTALPHDASGHQTMV